MMSWKNRRRGSASSVRSTKALPAVGFRTKQEGRRSMDPPGRRSSSSTGRISVSVGPPAPETFPPSLVQVSTSSCSESEEGSLRSFGGTGGTDEGHRGDGMTEDGKESLPSPKAKGFAGVLVKTLSSSGGHHLGRGIRKSLEKAADKKEVRVNIDTTDIRGGLIESAQAMGDGIHQGLEAMGRDVRVNFDTVDVRSGLTQSAQAVGNDVRNGLEAMGRDVRVNFDTADIRSGLTQSAQAVGNEMRHGLEAVGNDFRRGFEAVGNDVRIGLVAVGKCLIASAIAFALVWLVKDRDVDDVVVNALTLCLAMTLCKLAWAP